MDMMIRWRHYWSGLLVLAALSAGCLDNNEPVGLRAADPTGGPRIIFDITVRPFPDIPYPNDIATRVDPTSPTGKRVNVSLLGASKAEDRVRQSISRMTGFGLYSPLTVSFDAPLDIENIIERHHEDVPDFTNDVVYLVNVDPKSPDYGKFELLDMGRGNFPLTLTSPGGYFVNDSRRAGTNLLFETVKEVPFEDENGEFNPLADTDDDGVQDIPNLRDPDSDPYEPGQLLEFYERETNTLVMRPVHPLSPGTTYAVVLTSELRGEDGNPIESPFEYINHVHQNEPLAPLRELLPAAYPNRFDKNLNNVRFAWTFTTQVATEELEAIRAGLYGHGPLSWLSEKFPARLHTIHNTKNPDATEPLTLKLDDLIALIIPVAAQEVGQAGASVIQKSYEDVDYLISGTFLSPNFLHNKKGLAPTGVDAALPGANMVDDTESFDIRLEDGYANIGTHEVPFLCIIPKELPGRTAPFPTIIYSHAIGSTRLEILIFAGAMAKFGLATCTIDAMGHGMVIPEDYLALVELVIRNKKVPNLQKVLELQRARDLTNDGFPDSGGDYFTSDLLHSRDMMRQTTIDQMQLIRILRTFDGKLRWPSTIDEEDPYIIARRDLNGGWDQDGDGQPEIAGDFNGDGTVDLGGEQPYLAWGTSLGGIQTSILAGIEPTVRAAVSNAGGAGLADIAFRTNIGNVRAGVILRMLGPALIGRPYVDSNGNRTGQSRLDWLLVSAEREELVHFADLEDLEEGDRIVLRNLARENNHLIPEDEKSSYTHVRNGGFRVAVATDAISGNERRARLGFDPKISLFDDIMACKTAKKCGDTECQANSYCAPDNTCRPQALCPLNFDPQNLADPELAEELSLRTVTEPTEFGDPLVIEIYGADGKLKHSIDTFPQDLRFQNIYYPEGTPLAALMEGWGLKRQTPRFRSFTGIAQTLLEPADPAIYAPHYFLRPLKYDYETPQFKEGGTNFIAVGTLGDQTVPINTAIALARAAGALNTLDVDPRYNLSENDFLIKNFVYEGISWLNRFQSHPNTLFDPDNLDEGKFRIAGNPDLADAKPNADKPLRATVKTPYGTSALRLAYIRTTGEHTFNAPTPGAAFDINSFMTNQVGWFLATGGQQISDDHCLEKMQMPDCSFFNPENFQRPDLQ